MCQWLLESISRSRLNTWEQKGKAVLRSPPPSQARAEYLLYGFYTMILGFAEEKGIKWSTLNAGLKENISSGSVTSSKSRENKMGRTTRYFCFCWWFCPSAGEARTAILRPADTEIQEHFCPGSIPAWQEVRSSVGNLSWSFGYFILL